MPSRVSFQRFLLDILSSSFRRFCLHVIHQLTIFNVPVVAYKASQSGKCVTKKGFHYRSRDQGPNHVATVLPVQFVSPQLVCIVDLQHKGEWMSFLTELT